jgi:hypothetical protein
MRILLAEATRRAGYDDCGHGTAVAMEVAARQTDL